MTQFSPISLLLAVCHVFVQIGKYAHTLRKVQYVIAYALQATNHKPRCTRGFVHQKLKAVVTKGDEQAVSWAAVSLTKSSFCNMIETAL
jgi:hypothetical protein